MAPYGYPGVTGTQIDGHPYLCVSYDVERRMVQPLRLGAALVAAPLIVYAGRTLVKDKHRALGYATQAAGAAVGVWSIWVWGKAWWAMREEP